MKVINSKLNLKILNYSGSVNAQTNGKEYNGFSLEYIILTNLQLPRNVVFRSWCCAVIFDFHQ